ncbi:MAG TPA: transglutaminase-like domain-containing protein [Rudaea sp.]|nr:transglutaminase-like domain-containing protein [Rudaea sp.]
MRKLLILLALLAPGLTAFAAPVKDTWLSVLLDGRKIGNMHVERVVRDNRVVTVQTMNVELDRAGIKVPLGTSETDTETLAGEPLAFSSRTSISGIASVVHGTRRPDGKFDVTSEVGGAKSNRVVEWPHNALLAEGLRLAEQRNGLIAGTKFTEWAFQVDSLDAVEIQSTIGKREPVELPDGTQLATQIEQIIHLPGSPTKSVVWVDAGLNLKKLTLPMMGYELTMLACSQTCAQAPNQSADILSHALAHAPAAVSADALEHGLVISVSANDDGTALQFVQTDEQSVATHGNTVTLRIAPLSPNAKPGRETPPQAADSQANDWLQSNAPVIRKLAEKAAGKAQTSAVQMHDLQEFVRRYIQNKNLSIGYASALEVANKPEGDCTEHAVLLAALGRALGIPTRVVYGLAYTDHYAGGDHVFVPHAWTQAWVNGRWQSFDAALPGFDAGHIALSYGDGDPWRFFAGMDTLGRMRIDSVEPMHDQSPISATH